MNAKPKAKKREDRWNLVPAFVAVGLVFIAIGAVPLIIGVPGQTARQAALFDSARQCPGSVWSLATASSLGCRFRDTGTITAKFTVSKGRYGSEGALSVSARSGPTSRVLSDDLYQSLAVGSTYPIEIWQSKITCLFVDQSVCNETEDNPDLIARNNTAIWMLIPIAFGLLLAVPPLVYELRERTFFRRSRHPGKS